MPNLLIPSHSLNSSILHKIQQKSDYQGIILEDSGQDALDSNLSLENEIIIGCLTDPNSKRLLAELNVFAQKNPDASILFIPKLRLSRAGVACELPAETLQKLFSLSTLIHDVTPIAIAVEHQSYLAPIAKPKAKTATLGANFSIQEKSQEQQLNLFWESLLSAQEQAFSQQSVLNENLSHSLLYRLKYFGKTKFVIDGKSNKKLTFDKILGISLALAAHLKQQTQKKRIGILLPPSQGSLIVNLAIMFAGKIPVNLNFTSTKESLLYCIEQAEIDTLISAKMVKSKLKHLPWDELPTTLNIEEIIATKKGSIIKWLLASKLLSAKAIANIIKLPQEADETEASLLFTSGSSGPPKGVPLSHRNLLANVTQFSSRLELDESSTLLGCLPHFHSFGYTVTLLFPILKGFSLVTYPSPMEVKELAKLIEEHQLNLLLSTPTFLRGFLSRAQPHQLTSLDFVITGAEKLPDKLAQDFSTKFNLTPQEGYGLTETSPATHVNLPNPESDSLEVCDSTCAGTVGLGLQGINFKMTNPETGEPNSLFEGGELWLRGSNIFGGYLNRPEVNQEVLQEGWFKTGDMAKLTPQGFLALQGRLSRFSKIAGEMVPHETIEAELVKALDLSTDELNLVLVGVPDEKKGEALVILTTLDTSSFKEQLMSYWKKNDLTMLWMPKIYKQVETIPTLASGKLDLKSCGLLARGE